MVSYAPSGLDGLVHLPTAYAVGFIITPLRGYRIYWKLKAEN
jgi:hypothetical protein